MTANLLKLKDDEPVLTDDIYDILEDLKNDPPKPEKIAAFDNIPTDDLGKTESNLQ